VEHLSFGIVLFAVLGVTDALKLIPLALEEIARAFERSLVVIRSMVLSYRTWKADLWPSATAPVEVAHDNRSATPAKSARVAEGQSSARLF